MMLLCFLKNRGFLKFCLLLPKSSGVDFITMEDARSSSIALHPLGNVNFCPTAMIY